MASSRGRWVPMFAAWAMACPCLAQTLNYDTFSEADGYITPQQEPAALALIRDSAQLEALYVDVGKGNERALHVFEQLEESLAESGRKLAERTTRPDCLVPAYRELSKQCVPGWSFLDFLAKDKPAAARLRRAVFSTFAARAHERGLENRLILLAAGSLVSVEVAAAALREVEAAEAAAKTVKTAPGLEQLSRAAAAPDRGGLTKAGRALQKHGDRPGSAFPQTKGGPGALNPAGQKIVDEILKNPGSIRQANRFGGVDVMAPDGRGVRFDGSGQMMGFLEP